ncbi:MAG: sulfatase-like hydrolase/transferase [Myxococcota bacterium]|nr:sulfatase-like hydrolase/transferase [Myxococcota bacterium]
MTGFSDALARAGAHVGAGTVVGLGVGALLTAIEVAVSGATLLNGPSFAANAGVVSVLLGKNCALLFACSLVALPVSWLSKAAACAATRWLQIVVAICVAVDAVVWSSTRNHLDFYLAHAFEPEALHWAGGIAGVLSVLSPGSVELLLGAVALWGIVRFAARSDEAGATRSVGLVAAFLVLALPLAYQRVAPQARFFAELNYRMLVPWNLGFSSANATAAAFSERLAAVYAEHRPSIERAYERSDLGAPLDEEARPDILIVVGDSLRFDMVDPRFMPKLHALAMRWLSADRHYATGNRTPPGLYGLLHGRPPTWLRLSANANAGSPWVGSLIESGYAAYFVQGSPMWHAIEDSVPAMQFEMISETEGVPWQRDEQVFRRVAQLLEPGDRPPRLVVALLVSTHQGYSSNATYRKRFDGVTDMAGFELDDDQTIRSARRYLAAAAHLDDKLAECLAGLDFERTLVVVTADHGESFGEDDARYHGSRPSDIQIRVPLVLAGYGIPSSRRLLAPSSSVDVAATVVDALGSPLHSAMPGRSLLGDDRNPANYSTLQTFPSIDERDRHVGFLLGARAPLERHLVDIAALDSRAHYRGALTPKGDIVDPGIGRGPDRELLDAFEDYLMRAAR